MCAFISLHLSHSISVLIPVGAVATTLYMIEVGGGRGRGEEEKGKRKGGEVGGGGEKGR